MTEIIARRQFPPLYIWLDIAFLPVFIVLLFWKKHYMTVLVGLFFERRLYADGLRHFSPALPQPKHLRGLQPVLGAAVDVHKLRLHQLCMVWLWISKSKPLFAWSLLILLQWFGCPLLTQTFATDAILIPYRRMEQRTSVGLTHGRFVISRCGRCQ